MIHPSATSLARVELGAEPAPDLGGAAQARIVGLDRAVPISGGRRVAYVNFDNAATTPALRDVADCVTEFLEWYGSVHRGTGARSHVSTRCYDRSREIIAAFVGADPDHHTAIFTRNTTDSINKLAGILSREKRPPALSAPNGPALSAPNGPALSASNGRVLCTVLEHHSNLLPWRQSACRVECVDCRASDAALDLDQLEQKLRRHSGEVRLVAVTGASNVTGFAPPIHRIARLAHEHGAEIFVDAAQLAAHRALDMGKPGEPESLDYVAFSAHKMYAPFGAGILVGPKAAFELGEPAQSGGGAVRLVSDDRVIWADAPAREEAGTPNVVGAVAMARAAQALEEIGMERIAAHEAALRAHLVTLLRRIPRVRLFGAETPADHAQVGIIGFTAEGMDHSLLAAALGHEWGIGLRHGCFCAHPYVMRLLGVGAEDMEKLARKAELNDHSNFPGLLRISLGLYNTKQEADYVAEAIRDILARGPRERYLLDRPTGEYLPESGPVWPEECCPL